MSGSNYFMMFNILSSDIHRNSSTFKASKKSYQVLYQNLFRVLTWNDFFYDKINTGEFSVPKLLWAFEMGQGPCPIQVDIKFRIINGLFKF